MSKLKIFLEQSWLLVVSSFLFGLLIAVTNAALTPMIEQQKINKLNASAGAMLPAAKNFVPLEEKTGILGIKGKQQEVQVYRAEDANQVCVGWSFNATGSGFADKIELVIAVDDKFTKIAGYDVLSSNETPGFGDQIKYDWFRKQFAGAPVEELKLSTTGDSSKIDNEIISISGATISSDAVVDIVNNTVKQVKEKMIEKGLIGDGK